MATQKKLFANSQAAKNAARNVGCRWGHYLNSTKHQGIRQAHFFVPKGVQHVVQAAKNAGFQVIRTSSNCGGYWVNIYYSSRQYNAA